MIRVTCRCNTIRIRGHAGYAEEGRDIVCAAVSMLVHAFVESVDQLTEDPISYELAPGDSRIRFGSLSREGQLLLDSFILGVEMLAKQYPENVKIIKR